MLGGFGLGSASYAGSAVKKRRGAQMVDGVGGVDAIGGAGTGHRLRQVHCSKSK